MIKKAAAGYAGWLCANGIVAPEKNKIYAYGMELVLSGLVNVLSVLLSCGVHPPADDSGRVPRKLPLVLQPGFPRDVYRVGMSGILAPGILHRPPLSDYSSYFTCDTVDPVPQRGKEQAADPGAATA